MRRFSSALIRSADTGSPAGIPSRIATRPRPCDSPAVVKRKVTVPSNRSIITREPDAGSGSGPTPWPAGPPPRVLRPARPARGGGRPRGGGGGHRRGGRGVGGGGGGGPTRPSPLA